VNTATLNPGDVVEVDVKGRVFAAYYCGRVHTNDGRPVVRIDPLRRTINYFHVRARQIRRRLPDAELAGIHLGSTPPEAAGEAAPHRDITAPGECRASKLAQEVGPLGDSPARLECSAPGTLFDLSTAERSEAPGQEAK
jgi:hypothetical protein